MPEQETPQAEGQGTPTPEPSPLDAIRSELAVDDSAPVAAAPAAEPAAETLPADATPSADAAPSDTAEAAAAGFELTEAELAALINEVITVTEQTNMTKAEQKKHAATLEEAIKQAEEEDDVTALGKLALETYKQNKEQAAIREAAEKYVDAGREQAYTELDGIIESVYGDVLDSLSQEELDALDRSKFSSDKEHMETVFKRLDSKRADMVRSTVASTQEQEAEALSAAATAARTQASGIGVLPGGSGVEAIGDDIGSLLRQGLRSGDDLESD